MSRVPSTSALVSCAALVLLCASPAHPIPKKLDRWIEIQSESFTFYSNAGERVTLRIATDLELLRKVLSELSSLPASSPKPTLVYVFRGDPDFKPYKPLYEGKPANISGFFLGHEHANYIALDASSTIGATEIIYHEYIHYHLHSNFPEIPPWFDEGLAELYSSFDTDARHANAGKAIGRHIRWLKDEPLIPLAELLAVDRSSATYNEGTRQGSFYAQSWALVHYLLIGNTERRPQVARFLELIARNATQDDAFRTAFGADYETLEHELRAYVRKLSFTYYRYELKERSVTVGTARPLAAYETLTLLGDLLTYQKTGRPEAAEHFEATLEVAPEYGPALAGLGYLAERRERHQQARELYARAAASKDTSFVALFRAASHLLRHGGGKTADSLPWLERCVELQPGFAPCWALLSYAHTLQDEPPESALAAARRAHRMLPARTDVAYNLLLLAARRGDRSTVQLLVDGYFAGLSDPEERLRAEKALIQMDLERGWELVRGKDFDGAAELLSELEPRAAQVPAAGMAEPVGQLKEAIASGRSVERYNRALAHVDAGEIEQAIAVLEENPAGDAGEVTAQASRDLLDDLRARQAAAAARSSTEPSPKPSLVAAASAPPAQPSLEKQLNLLLARGRLKEALRLLERSRNAPAHVNDRFWIDHRIDQLRKALAYNRFVDRYNEAVDLVNAKHYAQAVALLEELVREAPDEDQAEDARGLLERTRAKMRR